jgi:hypothetical protein
MVGKVQLRMPLAIALVAQLAAKVATSHDGGMGAIVRPFTCHVHRLHARMSTERPLARVADLVTRRTQTDRGFALGAVHRRGAVLGIHVAAHCGQRGLPCLGCSFGGTTLAHVSLDERVGVIRGHCFRATEANHCESTLLLFWADPPRDRIRKSKRKVQSGAMSFIENSLTFPPGQPAVLWALGSINCICVLHSFWLHGWNFFPTRVAADVACLATVVACVCNGVAYLGVSDVWRIVLDNIVCHGICIWVIFLTDAIVSYQRWYVLSPNLVYFVENST